MRIKACTYQDENDTIDVVTTDGTKMCLLGAMIENSLNTDMIRRSKLVWLKTMSRSPIWSFSSKELYRIF